MKKIVMTGLAVFALTGCAPAGVKNVQHVDIDRSRTFEKPYDEVWADTIEWFASLGIPIDKLDKESGLISSEWGGTSASQEYISCGEPTGNIGLYKARFEEMSIDINIIVRPTESGAKSTINVFGSSLVDVSNAYGSVSKNRARCASRGILEEAYFQYVSG